MSWILLYYTIFIPLWYCFDIITKIGSLISIGCYNKIILIPKILWNQKLVICYLSTLWKDIYIYISILFDEQTTYFTSCLKAPSKSNPNSFWVCGEFLFIIQKGLWICFSSICWGALIYSMWLKLLKSWRVGCQKRSLFCP